MLTTAQLDSARTQNEVWRAKLSAKGQWPTEDQFKASSITATYNTNVFLQQVATYQTSKKLVSDGVVGPMTAGALRTVPWTKPAGQEYLLIDGKSVPVLGVSVVHPSDPDGLEFIADGHSAWNRTNPVRLFCLHAKGAEGSALNTWSFLRGKRYGVHLSLERDGHVWQYCDLKNLATSHAGKVNETSVGMEMANAVFPVTPNPYSRPISREPYTVRNPDDSSYGHEIQRRVLGLLPAQLETAVKIVTTTCDALSIPKEIPGRNGKIYTGLLPGFVAKPTNWKSVTGSTSFSGVIAHFHVTNGHADPPIDIFNALLDSGFKLKEI